MLAFVVARGFVGVMGFDVATTTVGGFDDVVLRGMMLGLLVVLMAVSMVLNLMVFESLFFEELVQRLFAFDGNGVRWLTFHSHLSI